MRNIACALLALSLPVTATADWDDDEAPAKVKAEPKAAEDDDSSAPAEKQEEPEQDDASESSVSTLTDAGDAPAMELGLEIGEPTALTFTLALNPAGRLILSSGFLHRLEAFQFGLEAPMIGAAYQHNLMQIPMSGWQTHLTVGAGALVWLRTGAQRMYPQLALSASVGLRMRSPASPMTMQLNLSPQIDVLPYVTPAVVGSFGLSFALAGGSKQAPPPEPETEDDSSGHKTEAVEEAKPKAKKRTNKKPKSVKPRRRSKKR
jgi:hypothetical protein